MIRKCVDCGKEFNVEKDYNVTTSEIREWEDSDTHGKYKLDICLECLDAWS